MASNVRGQFLWHELKTRDPRGATSFYRKTVGWSTHDSETVTAYTLWMARDRTVGGLMDLRADAAGPSTPHWLAYIGTDDAEVAVWEAQRLGGKVIRNTASIPTVGKFALLQDPHGAVFGVLEPDYEPGESWPPAEGDFSWHELITTDMDGAFRFYSALFGWQKKDAVDMGPDGRYQMYGLRDQLLGGMFNRPPGVTAPPHWVSYIRVPDAGAAARQAETLGAKIINGPMEVPGGDWIAQGIDPQGAEFAVHSLKPAARRRPAAGRTAAGKAPGRKKAGSGRKAAARGNGRKGTASHRRKKAAPRKSAKKSARKGKARSGR